MTMNVSSPESQVSADHPKRALRLLYVCNLAYGVTADSEKSRVLAVVPPVLPEPEVIADLLIRSGIAANSLHPHQAESRSGVDAFLYAETADAAILAFRGTLPVRLATEPGRLRQIARDWLNNTQAALVPGEPIGLSGLVHAGFGSSLEALWNGGGGLSNILPRIRTAKSMGKALLVTGHSKGGALACLAALRLAAMREQDLQPDGVYTFGAPRAGNRDFAAAFARSFRGNAWRFEFQDDIVPQLPPAVGLWLGLRTALDRVVGTPPGIDEALFRATLKTAFDPLSRTGGYESTGRLQFIDWNGHLVDQDSPELRAKRTKRLARALLLSLPEVGKAHLPMRGFGYMTFLEAVP